MKFLKKYWFLVFGLIFFLFLSYFHLGADPLFDWDEGIYGQIGRELKAPIWDLTWNGQPWFEKPPLMPLLVKLGFVLTTDLELGARLLMPIFGALVIIYVFLLVKNFLSPKIANYSIVFFLLAPLFLSRSRMLNTDIVLLASLTATIYYLLVFRKNLSKNQSHWQDYLKIVIASTIGFYAKGIMAVLPWGIWFCYLLFFERDLLIKYWRAWLYLITAIFLMILPWHIYMTVEYGRAFWRVYLMEQVFARTYKPIEYHFGGRLYYIKFLIENLKWVLLISFFGGISFLRYFIKTKNKLFWLLLIWGGLVLGLFTLAKTKLFWYVLPLYPVLAILFAYFSRSLRKIYYPCLALMVIWVGLFNYSKFSQPVSPLNARNFVAESANNECEKEIMVLVNTSERRSKYILPSQLQLSSSFIYGGAPSMVFYYHDTMKFFYRTDEFKKKWQATQTSVCAMITKEDRQNLDIKDKPIIQKESWQLIKKTNPE